MEIAHIERQSEWLRSLQREFTRIASRRVEAADVDDVVQDAMTVIAQKGIDRNAEAVGQPPPLAWCFQVLRHTIGNHYQRQRTRRSWVHEDAGAIERADGTTRIEAMTSEETLAVVEGALDELARTDAACAGYLSRMADGARAGDIADAESVERAAFYRRLYRCRRKLRQLLLAKGLDV